MIDVNVTLLIQMANVLVLLFLMNLLLYGPIRRMVAQRRQAIADRQGRIDAVDAEVASSAQEFSLKIQEARKQGRQKIQELKEAAYAQEKELLQQVASQASKEVKDMRVRIQSQIEAAREQLRGQIRAFSMELAQKILGRSL